ncbi:hypothetical protein SAMN05444372_101268 [Flavobacterium micromati]|jgi:hypothetical protein|uniref:Uncharacterized protein n=1 Tax=Flavobacterium micromati TaxID=229205 RepID=A0A1M5FSG2_9FLAO|nr:hypothetical protein [Flavobacterium micromati]MCL6460911.1 hypothetical protein [Flavobacterium micromati]SHF94354.1 hypothetical protein SAMN05444372_101268 [Flavobacterium micromati]
MDAIKQIYYNDFGTSFYWRKHNEIILDKVQLIFRETGFYFSTEELKQFNNCIKECFSLNTNCEDCTLKNYCHKFLLKTPCSQVDLAVTREELNKVKDLVEGTLFKIALNDYLYGEGMN